MYVKFTGLRGELCFQALLRSGRLVRLVQELPGDSLAGSVAKTGIKVFWVMVSSADHPMRFNPVDLIVSVDDGVHLSTYKDFIRKYVYREM